MQNRPFRHRHPKPALPHHGTMASHHRRSANHVLRKGGARAWIPMIREAKTRFETARSDGDMVHGWGHIPCDPLSATRPGAGSFGTARFPGRHPWRHSLLGVLASLTFLAGDGRLPAESAATLPAV